MEYKLPNQDNGITVFDGELLATADSRRNASDLRWTEIEIYRTRAGKYIVHKIGRTLVFHRGGQPCTSGTPIPGDLLDMTLIACPRCKPVATESDLTLEVNRHTVHVSTSAEGAVEACHSQDDDGGVYLTNPARQALKLASRLDANIHTAFYVQRVD